MPASEPYRIGVDLGGTKTEVVVLDPQDGVVFRERRKTPLVEGYHAVLNCVADLVRDGACRVPAANSCTVGIGIPGSVDAVSGMVRNANSVCLIGRPLQADLERLLGRRIGVRNDADCFAMAECRKGAGAGYGLVFGVIMGTGCGGGSASTAWCARDRTGSAGSGGISLSTLPAPLVTAATGGASRPRSAAPG